MTLRLSEFFEGIDRVDASVRARLRPKLETMGKALGGHYKERIAALYAAK
jgi:hypothetical protein